MPCWSFADQWLVRWTLSEEPYRPIYFPSQEKTHSIAVEGLKTFFKCRPDAHKDTTKWTVCPYGFYRDTYSRPYSSVAVPIGHFRPTLDNSRLGPSIVSNVSMQLRAETEFSKRSMWISRVFRRVVAQ